MVTPHRRYLPALLLAVILVACTDPDDPDVSPTPTPDSVVSTTTGTPAPAPSATATPTPEPTSSPPPTSTPELHFDATDLLEALADQDIHVQPSGRTVACTEVDGLPGAEYTGEASFVLWVYPTAEAAAAEWHVGPYHAVHRVPDCNRPPARIYARGNLVLWVSAKDRRDETALRVGMTFLGLDGRPLPSHTEGSVLMPSIDGDPLGSGTFLAKLRELGLSFTPYESLYCHPAEGVSLFLLAPEPVDGPSDYFELRVSPTLDALEAEWGLEPGGANGELTIYRMQNRNCQHPLPGTIYRNQNMLLMIPGGASSLPPESKATIIETFLALQP